MGYGFKEEDLVTLVKKYPELKDLELASGTTYQVPEDVDATNVEIKLYSEKSNEAYIVSKSGNSVNAEKIELQYEVEIKQIDGIIYKNFYDSVIKEINSPKVAEQISVAFKDEFSGSKGLRKEAFYQFQIEQYFDHGQFIKYGNVISATLIIGKAISKKIYQLNPENFTFMLLSENSVNTERPFYLPVDSHRVSSLFQLNRHHPVTGRHQPHNGIDFAAPNGTPIYPAMEGEVITVARTRSKGKYVTVRHENGYETTYIHLKKYAPGLRVGDYVELDQKIGEVGRTGFTTGAHLHFGVIKDGYFVNPIYLVKSFTYSQRDQQIDTKTDLEDKTLIDDELSDEVIEE